MTTSPVSDSRYTGITVTSLPRFAIRRGRVGFSGQWEPTLPSSLTATPGGQRDGWPLCGRRPAVNTKGNMDESVNLRDPRARVQVFVHNEESEARKARLTECLVEMSKAPEVVAAEARLEGIQQRQETLKRSIAVLNQRSTTLGAVSARAREELDKAILACVADGADEPDREKISAAALSEAEHASVVRTLKQVVERQIPELNADEQFALAQLRRAQSDALNAIADQRVKRTEELMAAAIEFEVAITWTPENAVTGNLRRLAIDFGVEASGYDHAGKELSELLKPAGQRKVHM